MTDSAAIYEKLSTILGDLLFAEPPRLTPSTTAADVDGWDSIVMINLLVAVEEEFGIRIGSRQVEKIATVGDLVALIVAGR